MVKNKICGFFTGNTICLLYLLITFELSNLSYNTDTLHLMNKLFVSGLVLFFSAMSVSADTQSPKQDVSSNIRIFSSVIKQLQTNYVDSIDMNDIVKFGIEAMLNRLDPYTEYFDEKEQKEFMDRNEGEYAGIGSYIMQRDGYVWVSGPREGSPADRAGLRQGDKFLEIDGVDVKGKTTTEVSNLLRGVIDTPVKVKILRPWVADSILTLTVVREKILMPSIGYYGNVADGIGYIQLSDFLEKSSSGFKDALNDLVKNRQIKGLIVDLRGNGGGYLQSAVDILGNFLPKGTEVLRTRGKSVLEEKTYKTAIKPVAPDLPLVVLIDDGSASSSEIFAGAIQDLDRGVIVGTRSFGKGLVQSPFALPGSGMLKVTTAKYYIPSGRLIQAIDYSKRAVDGSAKRIADSLTNEFRTAAGRIVRDGGGITPDVAVEYPEPSRITYNVVTDNWAFDFANKYFNEHPKRPEFDDIVMTDSLYAEFKRFIDPKKFNYDKVCEQALKSLREIAKVEGYMSEDVDSQITVLEGLMKHSLDKDLDIHRSTIAPYLVDEIVERYYYDRGGIRSALRHDAGLKKALETISDEKLYKSLLLPPAASQSGKKAEKTKSKSKK